MIIPNLAQRGRHQRSIAAMTMALCAIGIVMLFVAPISSQVGWTLLLGFGQGSALALALYFIISMSPTPEAAGALSGMAQAVGYLLAALGPFLVGVLHRAAKSWTPPLVLLIVITAIEGVVVAGIVARPSAKQVAVIRGQAHS